MKPSHAGNPFRASSMAGARIASRDSRPAAAWASPHDRTAPGTVIVSGPRRGSSVSPVARSQPASACEPARPEPLRAACRPVAASQVSQKASPPIPQPLGMTTPSAAFVAIAASTAEPPARSTLEAGLGREVVRGDHRAPRTAGQRDRHPGSFGRHAGATSSNEAGAPRPPT